ncbi:MAG: hypothetical protein ACE5OY_00505 [Candidatus Bathyarchaeia archaeon]
MGRSKIDESEAYLAAEPTAQGVAKPKTRPRILKDEEVAGQYMIFVWKPSLGDRHQGDVCAKDGVRLQDPKERGRGLERDAEPK